MSRLWRDEWCLRNDLLVVALSNGEVFVWNVGSAQIEHHFVDTTAARQFELVRGFAVSDALSLLAQVQHADGTCRAFSAHPLHRASPHLGANVLVLDVAAILRKSPKSVAVAKCALSLLMDWELHSSCADELEAASLMRLDVRPCYGHRVEQRRQVEGAPRHERAVHAGHVGTRHGSWRLCVFAAVDSAAGKCEPTNDDADG